MPKSERRVKPYIPETVANGEGGFKTTMPLPQARGSLRQVAASRTSHDEAVEEALCFGWIDSRPNTG